MKTVHTSVDQEKMNKAERLAQSVLRLSRDTLMVHVRFLDNALSRLKPVAEQVNGIGTDGTFLFYNALSVLKTYQSERNAINRDYFHMILHCIFKHMFVSPLINQTYWNLACDIVVENTLNELNIDTLSSHRQNKQEAYINEFQRQGLRLTAEKIYHHFLDRTLFESTIQELQSIFTADDHTPWYSPPDSRRQESRTTSLENGEDPGDNGGQNSRERGENYEDKSFDPQSLLITKEDWSQISRSVQQDLETFSKQKGDQAGFLMQNLREVNREKYDYSTFLRRFATMSEAMKVNDDEFDYIFYTYGLKLYQKMPLIEPLEYKDIRLIRDFAIAIDTSGSVKDDLVQSFITKTYNILKNTESLQHRINLHIIQCDAVIQESVRVSSQKEFDQYLKTMKLKGFGGTDFRPVFQYVDQKIKEGEFTRLKGLIYFTDGFGAFPERMPAYQAAFVFVGDESSTPGLPPWAIKLVLNDDDLNTMKLSPL